MVKINKVFHQLAPLLALKQMPESFRAFFIAEGYTEAMLQEHADVPDLVDHDNIAQNAEIHHAHSYKMAEVNGKPRWIDGDCLGRLKGLCADAHDFKSEGRLDDLRYTLAKMTHYRVDALTYPHLHRGQPWSKHHQKFEDEMGAFLLANQDRIGPLSFVPYKDIYKAARKTAVEMWYEGREVVHVLEADGVLEDIWKLAICRKCINGIGDLWTTLAGELKI